MVATRDGLRGLLERTTVATEEEARSLEKFKEQKMGQVIWICKRLAHRKFQTLDYNVRLADLQQTYARLAARTLERNTFVQVNILIEGQKKTPLCRTSRRSEPRRGFSSPTSSSPSSTCTNTQIGEVIQASSNTH